MPSILGVKTNKEHTARVVLSPAKPPTRKKRDQGRRLVLFLLFFFLFLLWAVEVEEELCSMPIQRRHAASSAGVAVPSRTRRLMTCIFASYFAFRSSFAFASSASLTFLRAASSSSILTLSRAAFARKRSVEVSTPSAAGAARAGGANRRHSSRDSSRRLESVLRLNSPRTVVLAASPGKSRLSP